MKEGRSEEELWMKMKSTLIFWTWKDCALFCLKMFYTSACVSHIAVSHWGLWKCCLFTHSNINMKPRGEKLQLEIMCRNQSHSARSLSLLLGLHSALLSLLMMADFPQECEEGADHSNNFLCPLCTLDFSSPEKLISHVYQVRATCSLGEVH